MVQMSEDHLDTDAGTEPRVATGCVVKLEDLSDSSEWEVTIVASPDANLDANRISDECPIGEALLGRLPGELVSIEAPIGTVQFRVVSVG